MVHLVTVEEVMHPSEADWVVIVEGVEERVIQVVVTSAETVKSAVEEAILKGMLRVVVVRN